MGKQTCELHRKTYSVTQHCSLQRAALPCCSAKAHPSTTPGLHGSGGDVARLQHLDARRRRGARQRRDVAVVAALGLERLGRVRRRRPARARAHAGAARVQTARRGPPRRAARPSTWRGARTCSTPRFLYDGAGRARRPRRRARVRGAAADGRREAAPPPPRAKPPPPPPKRKPPPPPLPRNRSGLGAQPARAHPLEAAAAAAAKPHRQPLGAEDELASLKRDLKAQTARNAELEKRNADRERDADMRARTSPTPRPSGRGRCGSSSACWAATASNARWRTAASVPCCGTGGQRSRPTGSMGPPSDAGRRSRSDEHHVTSGVRTSFSFHAKRAASKPALTGAADETCLRDDRPVAAGANPLISSISRELRSPARLELISRDP